MAVRRRSMFDIRQKSRAGSPTPPRICPPGTLRSVLAPAPLPRERGNSCEPPRTTSGAPLRRGRRITEGFCTRNKKTARGKLRNQCFRQMLHKKHANRAYRLNQQGIFAESARPAICGLRLTPGSGISARNGAVAEWLKAAVC